MLTYRCMAASPPVPWVLPSAGELTSRYPDLGLLVLFGSRARGEARPASDWDFGFLAGPGLDREGLLADLVTALGTDRVDLADLAQSGALLRFHAARDGSVVFERRPGAFERFWLEAVDFWCDAGPLIRTHHQEVLDRLQGRR